MKMCPYFLRPGELFRTYVAHVGFDFTVHAVLMSLEVRAVVRLVLALRAPMFARDLVAGDG